jgi:hypothetical protein
MVEQPNAKGYTPTQCYLGGIARAKTAKRHPAYGIFLPDVLLFDNLFPSTYQHGKAGGKARTIKALRDKNGRFVK